MSETSGTAAEKASRDRPPEKNGENGGHFDTEAEQVARMEGAEGVEREAPTEETMPDFGFYLGRLRCRWCTEMEEKTSKSSFN